MVCIWSQNKGYMRQMAIKLSGCAIESLTYMPAPNRVWRASITRMGTRKRPLVSMVYQSLLSTL